MFEDVKLQFSYLIARYIGRIANSGNVWTLTMMVMKAMYSKTFIKPATKENELKMVTLRSPIPMTRY